MQRGSTASLLHHGVSSLGMNLTQLETFDEEMTLKDDLLINKDAKIKELENIVILFTQINNIIFNLLEQTTSYNR